MGFISDALGSASDFVFGTDPSLETKSLSLQTKAQKDALNKLLADLGGGAVEGVEGVPFSGDLVAGIGENEQLIQDQLSGQITGSTELFDQIISGLTPLLAGDVGDFEEFFQETIAKPAITQFNEDVLPGLKNAFGPTDFFGSDRFRATERATEDLTDSLTAGRADIGFRTRESALDRILGSAGILGNIPGQAAGATQAQQTVAQTPRAIQQAELDAEFQEFLRVKVDEKDKRINQIMAALGVNTTENVGVGLPGSPGLINSFLSSAGSGKAISGLIG